VFFPHICGNEMMEYWDDQSQINSIQGTLFVTKHPIFSILDFLGILDSDYP
jgi:hypothetical protein